MVEAINLWPRQRVPVTAGLVSVVGGQRACLHTSAFPAVHRLAPREVELEFREGLALVPFYNEDMTRSGSHRPKRAHHRRGRPQSARSRTDRYHLRRREGAVDWLPHPRGSLCLLRRALSRDRRTYGRAWAQDDPHKAARVVTGRGRDLAVLALLTRHAGECRPARRSRKATKLRTVLRLLDPGLVMRHRDAERIVTAPSERTGWRAFRSSEGAPLLGRINQVDIQARSGIRIEGGS
jgi:hypothetical protein